MNNYCRKEVVNYATAMESELRENDYKGSWKDCDIYYLRKKLEEEVGELLEAAGTYLNCKNQVKNAHEQQRKHILSEAADVGNIAMMIADICGAL